jgi:hypothetical protein
VGRGRHRERHPAEAALEKLLHDSKDRLWIEVNLWLFKNTEFTVLAIGMSRDRFLSSAVDSKLPSFIPFRVQYPEACFGFWDVILWMDEQIH